MNIGLIGSGGREHALCQKIHESKLIKKIICFPGNAGTAKIAKNIKADILNFREIHQLVQFHKIDLVIVGPEEPLVRGLVDYLRKKKIKVFGPDKFASRLEGSKAFMKKVCKSNNIPTADYKICKNKKDVLNFLKKSKLPLVVKADGLAAGKGVTIAHTVEEAKEAIHQSLESKVFGEAGKKIVIEEFLDGEEASFIVMTDGTNVIPFASSQDHKALEDNDKGPNTGGMGAYSPAPIVDEYVHEKIMNEVIFPTLKGLRKDGYKYCGFLYAGMMIDKNKKLKVLEFNCRFGDPETQPIMMRLKSDLAALCDQACDDNLIEQPLEWDSRKAIGVVLAARGYPHGYARGKDITNIPSEKDDLKIFHAGTKIESNSLKSNGGRVLCVTTLGDSVESAQNKAYDAISEIVWEDAFYRKDIGYRAIARERK